MGDQELVLARVPVGGEVKTRRLGGSGSLRRRMMEMGLVPGAVAKVEGMAPFGDPIKVRVRGYQLSLRKEEAATVFVEAMEAR